MDRELDNVKVRIHKQMNPTVRGFLMLAYFRMAANPTDSTMGMHALADIPPGSPLWSLVWGGPEGVFGKIARSVGDTEIARKYAEDVVATHRDSSVSAAFLFYLLGMADHKKDRTSIARYYAEMIRSFPGTRYAEWAKRMFAPDRRIVVGAKAPPLKVRDLENVAKEHDLREFRGKYVLIEFWTTWCLPCREQAEYIAAAWTRYRRRGLAVLSVSLDDSRDVIREFKARKKMPWGQGYADGGFGSGLARDYEIVAVPRVILIDPGGAIIAVDEELRGAKLEETLASKLGKRHYEAASIK